MTTEEKAKAYDIALIRAKQKHGKFSEFVTATIEDIFPELRESEDERIRKALHKMAKVPRKEIYEAEGITKEQALAWLEKQKEPVVDKEGMYYYLGGEFVYCGFPVTTENPYDFAMSQQEKQKEQSLRDFIDDFPYSDQKEQKPAEWSEEDEKMIDTIVSVLGQYIDYKTVSGTGSGYATPRYSKEIDWLKSLRPSWKPSEEQMEALRRAVNKLAKSDVADSVRLSIMYDNLEKRM